MGSAAGVRDCWKIYAALEGSGNGGMVVGVGTITRSHVLRTVENSSALAIENAATPAAVARSLPKYCGDVQMHEGVFHGSAEI